MSKTKVYVAAHCQPCQAIKELLEKRRFLVNGDEGEVDLIDIETEEGFKQIFPGLEGVPSAYRDGKKCNIQIDGETLLLDCPDESSNPRT